MTIVGAALMVGGMGLVAFGEQTVPSGIAALIIAMMPLWVAVLGRVFFGERLPRIAIVGIAIGLARRRDPRRAIGVGRRDVRSRSGSSRLLLSPISWALGSLFSSHRARSAEGPARRDRRPDARRRRRSSSSWPPCSGEYAEFRIDAVSPESLAAFVYLTVVGSLVAFTTYVWLLKVAPLPLIATYAYVNPIVAVILGAIVLQEPITPRTLVAGAVIIFAVALIITARAG